ncbi:hypothetical protein KCP76_03545 [Salmonella enterica subsp. enterica serovar Weltevreden]|nr:hypothetical protein KCP76_03545 [Salmonella enterica subsp. enterica serovar Weltevreden]
MRDIPSDQPRLATIITKRRGITRGAHRHGFARCRGVEPGQQLRSCRFAGAATSDHRDYRSLGRKFGERRAIKHRLRFSG